MKGLVSPRPDLYPKLQVANRFGISRDKLDGIILGLGIKLKSDPARPHCLLLDTADIERIAAVSPPKQP